MNKTKLGLIAAAIGAVSYLATQLSRPEQQTGLFTSPIPTPKPKVGVWASYGTPGNLIAETGAIMTRFQLQWSLIEPMKTTPATYQWSQLDQIIASLASEGISPIIEVRGNPAWAAATACGPIADYAAYDRFLRALVDRYKSTVTHWEIVNEPDNVDMAFGEWLGGCYGNYPVEYVQTLQTAYGAIKGTDASAIVLLGGLAHEDVPPFRLAFLDDILAAGAGSYFDVMNIHHYSSFAPNWAAYGVDVAGKVAAVRAKMAGYGVSKPLAITEIGWTSTPADDPGFEQAQADYVGEIFLQHKALGLYATIWFCWQDWPGADYPYGLTSVDGRKRPAYTMFQVWSGKLQEIAPYRVYLPLALKAAPAQ